MYIHVALISILYRNCFVFWGVDNRFSLSLFVSPSFSFSVFIFLCPSLLQLRLAVVEALGYCVHLLSADALNEQLPKLVPGVIQLYKKQTEHYFITQVSQLTPLTYM